MDYDVKHEELFNLKFPQILSISIKNRGRVMVALYCILFL